MDLETHLETIASYLNEYKVVSNIDKRREMSRIFVKYIVTSCWPKMHRRVYSGFSLHLIKQLCTIDDGAIRSQSAKGVPALVGPDIALLNFLQLGWAPDGYLPRLLDHHPLPNVDTPSTNPAPYPQKLLDAIICKATYTYSADVAIDFHRLLTSSLIICRTPQLCG